MLDEPAFNLQGRKIYIKTFVAAVFVVFVVVLVVIR
jgi:hypothetical protein